MECSIATSCDQATLHDGRLSVAKMRQDAESDSLKRLFSSVTNRAAFARQHKLRSDPSLIGQHMSGHRPISLEAGIEYAKAFGVSLEEISQRLAALVRQATAVMSAPPDGPSAPWPFDSIEADRWDRLSERQKGMVESAALKEIERIEAALNKQARPPEPPAPPEAVDESRKRQRKSA